MPIWAKGDPVHLTPTAYGDVADALVSKISSTGGEAVPMAKRKRIESVVTRIQATSKSAATPGWILGDCSSATQGRGGPGRDFGGSSRTAEAAGMARHRCQLAEPVLDPAKVIANSTAVVGKLFLVE